MDQIWYDGMGCNEAHMGVMAWGVRGGCHMGGGSHARGT